MNELLYENLKKLTADEQPSQEDQQKINVLDKIIEHEPHNFEARMKKGFIFFESQMDGKAIETFNSVLELDPNYVDAYIWLAELLLFHWADSEHAIPLLEKAQAIDAQRAEIYYLVGCAHIKRGRIHQAIVATQKAVELEPTWTHPRMCLIEYLLKAGNTEEAKKQLQLLEENLQPNIAEPTDEMEYYYEKLITGRFLQGYSLEGLNDLRKKLGH